MPEFDMHVETFLMAPAVNLARDVPTYKPWDCSAAPGCKKVTCECVGTWFCLGLCSWMLPCVACGHCVQNLPYFMAGCPKPDAG
jgi:hypothetical protein